MEIKNIYNNLRAFTIEATGYSANKVIFANQLSNARPKKPFITIDISKFRNVSTPIVKKLDENGMHEITVPMVFTASFTAYSDKVHEAEEVLETLHIKLYSELANDIFKGELSLRKARVGTTAVPRSMNEQIESRAILEVDIGFNKTTQHDVGLIETVIADAVVNEYQEQLIIRKGN